MECCNAFIGHIYILQCFVHQEKNSASGRRGSVRAQQALRTLRTQTGKVFCTQTTHVSAQVAPNDTRHAICLPDAKCQGI